MRKQLGEILLGHKIITPSQLEEALEEQKLTQQPLGKILIAKGWVTDKLLIQALAAQKGVSAWFFENDPPQPNAIQKLNKEVCAANNMLPVMVKADLLVLAMANPDDIEAIDLARNISGNRIEPVMADERRLKEQVEKAYRDAPREVSPSKASDAYLQKALQSVKEGNNVKAEKAILTEEDTRPVVGLVNQILSEAISSGSSDIHVEPMESRIDIRHRVDGQLLKVMEVPDALGPMLTTRIKIMAGIDIVETRIPQDGRITAELDDRTIDLRVSVLPGYHGPRIVLRILDKEFGLKALDEIGFDPDNYKLFKNLVSRPYGLFLVTGPTGSGKTTTLYAALNEIRNGENNVLTCEDPVEYLIDGIGQSQINEKVGLTFASQLRAILRQDPDVVLVGEIRDQDTAETAIRASMTGHMVLSTLHTNDAPAAIPRLTDMGIDPFLLSTSLVGVLSQRLLRRLCDDCKREIEPSAEEIEVLNSVFSAGSAESVFRAPGCPSCRHTGYRGRIAVHELMPVTSEIRKMIAERVPVEAIRETAGFYGYRTMQEDAFKRIQRGETSVQEAKRLIAFETIERKEEHSGSIKLAA
ncbi:MAG: Flp pilus assembly complex ATPase component TadA [Armatimonadetes bacterium]|nr:Flp pilus assembly complex ATPase component TadA [Armatimonadota bacterium]